MVRIKRGEAPDSLATRGQAERAGLTQRFEADAQAFIEQQSADLFKSSIYASDDVKESLKQMQAGKCCFCESKMLHVDDGDVEHFRPKAGWMQDADDYLHRPGYFWLAYEWSNLFLSCAMCNQRFKKNLFPLLNPDQRADVHERDVSGEQPVFIDVVAESPEDHIAFNQDIAVGLTERGKLVIDLLHLNREDLVESRRSTLAMAELIRKAAALLEQLGLDSADFRDRLREVASSKEKYALMVRCHLHEML